MCVDVVVKSQHVFTGEDNTVRPAALCIKDGKIISVQPYNRYMEYVDSCTEIYDYGNSFVCPGLHDSHMHVFHSALYASPLAEQFLGSNEQDCVARLEPLAARRPYGWLLAQGWREYRWDPPVLPSKASLDKAYPSRPVALYSGDAHTLWLNSCALNLLGITNDSVAPVGGGYDRDEHGELTGIVRETAAMELMPRIVQSFSIDELVDAYESFLKTCSSYGITSVCDMSLMAHPGLDFVRDDIYAELLRRNQLPVRIHMFPTLLSSLNRFERLQKLYRGPLIMASGLKQFYDGVSSQHTAYLKQPYTNAHFEGDTGRSTMPFEEMKHLVFQAAQKGYQVRVHTIGDQAIHEMLDIYEQAQRQFGYPDNGHHCLEHLENFQPQDIERLAQLGVIAAVQPLHITLDPGGPERDLGMERIAYMWPFASYQHKGVLMALGTDSPVVDVNPLASLYTAVTRRDAWTLQPEEGWQKQECITAVDALRAYTQGSARAAGRKDIGKLVSGMWADMAVFDTCLVGEEIKRNPERLLDARVVATHLAGACVYSA